MPVWKTGLTVNLADGITMTILVVVPILVPFRAVRLVRVQRPVAAPGLSPKGAVRRQSAGVNGR